MNSTMKNTLFFLLLTLSAFLSFASAAPNPAAANQASKVQPFSALMERANEFYREGKYGRAMILYRRAEQRGADPVFTSFNTGNCYYRLEKYADAAGAFRKAVRMSQNGYPPALFNLSAVLYQLGEYSEAIAVWHRALREEPDNASAWLYLAEAYEKTGDPVGAQRALEKARALLPDDITIIYQLAETHVSQKEYQTAVDLVREAYVRMPEETDFLIYIGDIQRLAENLEASASSYREALTLQPLNIDLMYKLADVLATDNKSFLAMDYLRKALQIDPQFTDAWIFLGNLAYDAKWWERAEDAYFSAIAAGNSEGLQGLRNIIWEYTASNNTDEALRLLRATLKVAPDNQELRAEIRNLESED